MRERTRIKVIAILLRIVYKLCYLNPHDILLAWEISAWQDIYDPKARTVFPRPLYPQIIGE